MNYLVLLRHGQSQWNLENRFTGFTDVELTDEGIAEAKAAGKSLSGNNIDIDQVFTSTLKRANKTAELALEAADQTDLISSMIYSDDLRERDYGDLTGLNKDETRAKFGEDQVHIWRRSYDVPPPGGECLQDVVEKRVRPYYEEQIKPLLDDGKNIMIAAHGNSLRAMLIILGVETPDTINQAEIPTGAPLVFELENGSVQKRYFLDKKRAAQAGFKFTRIYIVFRSKILYQLCKESSMSDLLVTVCKLREGKEAMDIKKVPIGADVPNDVNVIVENQMGGQPVKYELDKESGAVYVDRFLHTAMFYPGNYGFIPHTLSDDGEDRGIKTRFFEVHDVGSDNVVSKDVKAGDFIAVPHGRWSRGFKVKKKDVELEVRMVDENDILLVSDDEPDFNRTQAGYVNTGGMRQMTKLPGND